jgi:hypothetical protein
VELIYKDKMHKKLVLVLVWVLAMKSGTKKLLLCYNLFINL